MLDTKPARSLRASDFILSQSQAAMIGGSLSVCLETNTSVHSDKFVKTYMYERHITIR